MDKRKPRTAYLVLIIFIAFSLISAAAYLYQDSRRGEGAMDSQEEKPDVEGQDMKEEEGEGDGTAEVLEGEIQTEDENQYNTRYYDYSLTEIDGNWDQKIVRKNKQTGEEEIIVPSTKEALPLLKERFNLALAEFSEPEDSDQVFYSVILDGTDNPSGDTYAFDTVSLAFDKMKINEIYDGFFGGFAMAPDGIRFAWIPDPYWDSDGKEGEARIMYLVDLMDDSYEPIVTLSGNETFNGGDHAMGVAIDVGWPEADKIVYSVYDASRKGEYDYENDPKGALKALLVAERTYIVRN